MSLDNLHQRIDKLLAHIDRSIEPDETLFNMCFFTDSEQVELQLFLEQVDPKIERIEGRLDLQQLTDQELDRLRLWLHLENALKQEDIDAAALYRQHLNQSLESLLARFRAIPESSIPDHEHAPVITRDNTTYHLYRTYFRHDRASVERDIANNRFTGSVLATMRRWVDVFSPGIAA